MKNYIQIERSGSTQTAYTITAARAAKTLEEIQAEGGEISDRQDLVECANIPGHVAKRVIQVRFTSGVYAGTTGKFFAEI